MDDMVGGIGWNTLFVPSSQNVVVVIVVVGVLLGSRMTTKKRPVGTMNNETWS